MTRPDPIFKISWETSQIFKYSSEIRSDLLFLVTEGNSLQLRNNLFALSESMEITTKRMAMTRKLFNISNDYYLFH